MVACLISTLAAMPETFRKMGTQSVPFSATVDKSFGTSDIDDYTEAFVPLCSLQVLLFHHHFVSIYVIFHPAN